MDYIEFLLHLLLQYCRYVYQEGIEPAMRARKYVITYTHNVNGKIQTWCMVP